MSVDPLAKYYPYWSPYLFAANNPLRFIDLFGMGPEDGVVTVESNTTEDIITEQTQTTTTTTTQPIPNTTDLYKKTYNTASQKNIFELNNLKINNSEPTVKETIIKKTTTTTVTINSYSDDGKTLVSTYTYQKVETTISKQYSFYQTNPATSQQTYIGGTGEYSSQTTINDVDPTVSPLMDNFSKLTTLYRNKTGKSFTNVNDYISESDINMQKDVMSKIDDWTPLIGVKLFKYGSLPSLAFSMATMGLQGSLERGLQNMENSRNNCTDCIKTYHIVDGILAPTSGLNNVK